jgi:hypothetical protein
VLGVVEEADGAGALRDAGRLVVGGEDDAAAETRNLVAVGVIGEGIGRLETFNNATVYRIRQNSDRSQDCG